MLSYVMRLYLDALSKGNPFVIGLTIIVAVAVGAGPFYKSLSSGDPWAIGLVVLILVGIALVVTVAIIDRRINSDQKKQRPPAISGWR